jgi:hypothetical protein
MLVCMAPDEPSASTPPAGGAVRGHPESPSGWPPPVSSCTPDGREIDLVRVARRACVGFVAEFPDYATQYGPAGMPWCVHDTQHILNWAVLSLGGSVEFEHELAWLARVLEAREFSLARLVRGVELLAGAVREDYPDLSEVAERVDSGAAFLASRQTFLT